VVCRYLFDFLLKTPSSDFCKFLKLKNHQFHFLARKKP
jgi:hypothetical protein